MEEVEPLWQLECAIAANGEERLRQVPVTGQFSAPKDADHCTFTAKKGKKFLIDVSAERLGSPADPDMEIAGADGQIINSLQDTGENTGQLRFPMNTRDIVDPFLPDTKAMPSVKALRRGRSMLDFVGEQSKRLQGSLSAGDRARVDQYFTLARDLEQMLLYGTDMGSANAHSNVNLPVLLAGGGFRHGQHLAFDTKNNYPLTNLDVSMLQRLDLREFFDDTAFANESPPNESGEFFGKRSGIAFSTQRRRGRKGGTQG